MTLPSDAFEAALAIADALERHGVPYALGGAHAYGQYGIPRATNDVDVNVFVESARRQAEDQGMFVARLGPFRIDVFTPSIDFAWEAERTRVAHVVEGRPVWFLSPEALCVFKLLFFRGKDVVDLERLIAVQGAALDRSYVRSQIAAMMGEDDPRVATWERLWSEHGPG